MPLLIDVRKLTLITELIEEGALQVAESLGTLAGAKRQQSPTSRTPHSHTSGVIR